MFVWEINFYDIPVRVMQRRYIFVVPRSVRYHVKFFRPGNSTVITMTHHVRIYARYTASRFVVFPVWRNASTFPPFSPFLILMERALLHGICVQLKLRSPGRLHVTQQISSIYFYTLLVVSNEIRSCRARRQLFLTSIYIPFRWLPNVSNINIQYTYMKWSCKV